LAAQPGVHRYAVALHLVNEYTANEYTAIGAQAERMGGRMRVTYGWNRIVLVMGVTGLLLAAGPRAAWSHAADAMAAPPGAVVIAPRAEARIGQTEIVTVFAGDIYAAFLTRFADDVPITGAKVEASTDLQSAELTETDPGVYSTRELLMSSGRNDVTLKITVGGVTSTKAIALMMPIEAPETAVSRPAITSATPLTIAGATLAVYALLTAAFLVARRRSPRRVAVRAGAQVRGA
jgi:hypothetical protein